MGFPGASVNDVMLATLTLTLQRYFREVGQEMKAIRGNFPINMRSPAEANVLQKSMGNRVAACNFTFPMKVTDPAKMIWEIKSQIDTIKCSPAAVIQKALNEKLVPGFIEGGKRKELVDLMTDTFGKVTA